MEANPLRNPDLICKDLGGEAMLYSSTQKAVHILNPTAQLIWELCDGNHSLDDMEQAIRSKYAVPEGHDLHSDIHQILENFRAKQILVGAQG